MTDETVTPDGTGSEGEELEVTDEATHAEAHTPTEDEKGYSDEEYSEKRNATEE